MIYDFLFAIFRRLIASWFHELLAIGERRQRQRMNIQSQEDFIYNFHMLPEPLRLHFYPVFLILFMAHFLSDIFILILLIYFASCTRYKLKLGISEYKNKSSASDIGALH